MMTATLTPRPVAVVPRLWPGETVVCLGGGSSLTAEDVAFCRDKARVIAIKEAGCCRIPGHVAPAPWADVLYGADEKYWRFVQGAPEFRGLKYSIQQDRSERPELRRPVTEWAAPYPDLEVLRDTGVEGLESDPSGLRTGFNSGYQAIGLAVHFGATRIVLLGYDMWRGPSGKQNWFGPHPTHLESQFELFLNQYLTIVEPLKQRGVTVLNASRFTMMGAFPKVRLEEAFA
jgi:hypothetical protein